MGPAFALGAWWCNTICSCCCFHSNDAVNVANPEEMEMKVPFVLDWKSVISIALTMAIDDTFSVMDVLDESVIGRRLQLFKRPLGPKTSSKCRNAFKSCAELHFD